MKEKLLNECTALLNIVDSRLTGVGLSGFRTNYDSKSLKLHVIYYDDTAWNTVKKNDIIKE